MVNRSLLTSSAVALVLCAAPAYAQQQKEGMPGGNATGGEGRAAQSQTEKASPQKGAETGQPKSAQGETKGQAKGAQTEPQGKSKSSAETQPKEPGTKGSAQSQPKEQSGKGTAQTQQKEPDGKGTAQTQPKDQSGKGTAQTQQKEPGAKGSAQTQPKEQGGKGTATGPSPKGSDTAKAASGGGRVQLSEQQRTDVHSTILKEPNLNRATNVNFSINVGTRVPRSVHLVALPASVISLVPQYREYRYFAANDQICIVDPNSYEIVEVIAASGRTAGADNRGNVARLTLTEEERAIIVREVSMDGGSTMGLGALSEGAQVPRDVQLRPFPDSVVRQVPKVRTYQYVAAENRVAIVEPQGAKVELVIDSRR